MTWCMVYAELKTWQTVIGSVLGFGALMAVALWNFRLNIRRDAQLREEETVSVASALYGEILQLRKELARIARSVARQHQKRGFGQFTGDQFDRHFIERFKLAEPILYPALASKLGLLPAELLLRIVSFYTAYQETKAWLPMLVDDPGRGFSYSVLTVLKPAKSAISDVEPALRAIEKMAGIDVPADQPPSDPATDVIEIEDDAHSTAYKA